MGFFIPTAAAGNGLTLATFGRAAEIMGFFYPRIDFAQNVREGMPAVRLIGPSGESQFLWLFHECWRVAQSFEPRCNVLITRLAHREIDLSIEFTDVLPPGEHALLRRVVVTRAPVAGAVQFIHYFRLAVSDQNTRNGVVVYPGRNLILQHFRDVNIGVSASEPFAGTCSSLKPDMESPTKQGIMSGHIGPYHQAIGRCDFAMVFEPVTAPRWETVIALAGGETQESAGTAAMRLAGSSFSAAVDRAAERTSRELADAGDCFVPDLADAYERAVIALHDLYDEHEGTFIAAPEFDPGYELSGGYGYCWPRDAAVCALAMQRIGRPDHARRFFEWCARAQLPSGHWYQRYWTDGTPASGWCIHDDRIQLDQTCALLHAAGLFARRVRAAGASPDGFVKSFIPTAERALAAILAYIGEDGLHLPATDLWENSLGAFAYTQAAVIAALREADEVFGLAPAQTNESVRTGLREVLISRFWQPERRQWLRRISPEGRPDPTLDSSAMGLIDPWEVLDLAYPEDRLLAVQTLDGISASLRSPVKAGSAILRFQGESYMGGGPGCVNTLWLAVCRLRLAATAEDPQERREQRSHALADIAVALANTSPTGQLPELIPKIQFDYWAAPHAWASSLLIEAVCLLRRIDPSTADPFDSARAQVQRRAPSH